MTTAPETGLVRYLRDAAVVLTTASGILYACGYLVHRARAFALGTEPDFALIDEVYVYMGFRFALMTTLAALIVMPLLVTLRVAARRLEAAPAFLAIAESVAVVVVALMTLGWFWGTILIRDVLLSDPPVTWHKVLMWDAILQRNNLGMYLTLAGTALFGCSALWLRAHYARTGSGAFRFGLAVIAALQLVLLPLQHGVFYAAQTARMLERIPEGLAGIVPPIWIVDRGSGSAVLLARDATGRAKLIPLKAEKLDGIGVIRNCNLGTVVYTGACP